MNNLEDFKILQESYEKNINDLNIYLSKKFFSHKTKPININVSLSLILSYCIGI